jgi:hypothetical protein
LVRIARYIPCTEQQRYLSLMPDLVDKLNKMILRQSYYRTQTKE